MMLVEHQRGLALVSVLWALSILSLIAASMMSTGSLSLAMARNALKRAQSDRIAESAVALGVLGLLDPRPDRRWRVDGVPQDVVFDGIPIRISIQDEFGLIDLNQAGVELFRGLFRSAGVTEEDAERLANRVVTWRTSTPRGSDNAVAAEYRRAGLPYAARGAPFESVDELRLVLGVTPEVFSRVAPALTVYSQQPSVDQRVAPREALLALPGIDGRQAEAILRERSSTMPGSSSQRLRAGGIDPNLGLSGRAFTITSTFTYRETAMRTKASLRISTNQPLQLNLD